MCEAQLQASTVISNSAIVVINHLHDNYDQHPRLKQGVGERLALAARSVVYGEDRKFQPAQAVLDGDTIVVQSESVRTPVAVRFNWGNPNPVCALFNRDHLPLSAFRTDDWPLP